MNHGFTVWLTGLSGSGKSTVAGLLAAELERRGRLVEQLDGDVVRARLGRGLGFTREDRDANIETIGWLAARFTRHGAAVVVAAISPYEEARLRARKMVEEFGPFLEVFVCTALDECARRDPKGLYKRAFAGEIDCFTGVSDPYEPPRNPELLLDTAVEPPPQSAGRILAALAELGFVEDGVAA
jgi:adenylylsulfate kinase